MKSQVQTPESRLREWAKDEIQRYRNEIQTGEPPFPQYAYDVLEVLDHRALEHAVGRPVEALHLVKRGPCPGCLPAMNPPPEPGQSCCVCDYRVPVQTQNTKGAT